MLPWLATIALLLPSASPQEVECHTCLGNGHATIECPTCEGAGKGPCPDCNYDLDALLDQRAKALSRYIKEKVDREKVVSDREKAIAALADAITGTKGGKHPPGLLPCPAFCSRGKVGFGNSKCKLCKGKGALEYKTCRESGSSKCFHCNGKKNIVDTCHECAGRGKSTDPLRPLIATKNCPWCDNERTLACHACEDGHRSEICASCLGDGVHACLSCKGSKRASCRTCRGAGEIKNVLQSQSKKCAPCKGKGSLKCEICKKGRHECGDCFGKGTLKTQCRKCFGSKKALCQGCAEGAGTSWFVTAERLFTAGRAKDAADLYEEGLRREEKRVERRYRVLEEDSTEYKELKRSWKAAEKKLRKRLAQLRQAQNDG